MPVVRFTGFAPDLPTDTPGVIRDCVQLISNEHSMIAAPAAAAPTGLTAVVAQVRGAATVTSTSGTRRTFAGTQTDLYELNGTTWSDVGASSLSGSSENRWSFAQFGNATIAANNVQRLQASTSGNFTEITTAPVAEFIVAAKDFVLAFNTNEATFGDQSDRWWSSAFQDHSSWTIDQATQATSGRLIGAGGALTAAAMLGPLCIAYKARQMFQGQYIGPPVVWQWDAIVGDQGCVGPEAVADIGGAHIFVGEDNIWLYDGTRVAPIASDIRQWFFTNLSGTFKNRTIVGFERKNARVWIFYPDASSTTGLPNSAVVYHLKTKRWGRANRTIEAVLANYTSSGVTWDTLSGVSATWDGLPDIPWDSAFWQSGTLSFSVFDTLHKLQSLIGSGEDCSLSTGDIGDDIGVSSVNQVVTRYNMAPVSATITGQISDALGGSLSTGGSGTYSNEKFDIRQTARWHRFVIAMTGDVEISGMDVRAVRSGKR